MVVIEKDATPCHSGVVHTGRVCNGRKGAIPVVEEEFAGVEVGDVQVHPSIVVDVGRIDSHAISLVVQSDARSVLGESPLTVVPEELVDLVAVVRGI